jgi:hypothetical protein
MSVPNPSHYALEKFYNAMYSLAVGPGDVRARLVDASLSFIMLTEQDFPEHLRADWRWICEQLTRFGPLRDRDGKVMRGSVDWTMWRIKRATGVKIAKRVMHVYHELEQHVNPR